MAADHYCTLDDVNARVPQSPFTPTSRPTAAIVEEWIDDVATEMDATLGNIGYVTPVIAGDKALAVLRLICVYGVLGLAQAARGTAVSTSVKAGTNEVKNIWIQLYEQRMKALADPQNPFELSDAPRTAEQLEKQPENVLRSFVQSVSDPAYDPDNPVVTRYQVL